jgi:hypothetical protein
LYKETGIYSGYGFDEFNNEVVGIRALVVKELKRYHKSPWYYLERQGGTELLESLLDQHEREAKEMQHSLQSLKRRMIEDINKRLSPSNLKFATQDKMERLFLTVQGRRVDLERRAGSFQIEGPLLPNKNQKPDDWNYCSLYLTTEKKNCSPPLKKLKRRPVILDSDSEDEVFDVCDRDDTKSNKKAEETAGKSSGLIVRIDSSCSNTEKENSLAVIKNQLGVNTHDLEQAREILEGEDANSKSVFEQEKVARLESILNRVLTRDEIDEDEVWDARECLRYAYMEAGNKYLWDPRVRCIDNAIDNFEKAKEIVESQQKSQQQLAGDDLLQPVQLSLLYLQGQAVVNIGISLVDSCHRSMSTSEAKMLRAIDELKNAQILMTKLRGLAEKARQLDSSRTEVTSYILKSKQLESLAYRWMGRGFWSISKEKKSIAAFEQASQFFNAANFDMWQKNGYLEDDILEVAAEAIYATCDLADRCYSRMKELEKHSPVPLKKGNETLDTVIRALTRHIEISESIERHYCSFRAQHFRVEYDISSIEEVGLHRDEIIKGWKDLVNKEIKSSTLTKETRRLSVKRPDITSFTNALQTSDKSPTNFIFSSDGIKRRRYQAQRKGSNKELARSTNIDALHALPSEGLHHRQRQPIKFRKWGDGILVAEQHKAREENSDRNPEESGSYSLVLAYPSVAPPIPKEFQFVSNSRAH